MGLARGKARVQFLACKDELEALLERGETFSEAHRILMGQGKITMSLSAMYCLYSGKTRRKTKITMFDRTQSGTVPDKPIVASVKVPTAQLPTLPSSGPAVLGAQKPKPFVPQDVDVNDAML